MSKKNIRKTHLIKNKGLRRVCAVVCLCFCMFVVALPFTRFSGILRVSADSLVEPSGQIKQLSFSDNSFIINFTCVQCFYVDWANDADIATVTDNPNFVITPDYKIIFAVRQYPVDISNADGNTLVYTSYIKTSIGDLACTPEVGTNFGLLAKISYGDKFGDSEQIYNALRSSYAVNRIDFINVVAGGNHPDNVSMFDVFLWVPDKPDTVTLGFHVELRGRQIPPSNRTYCARYNNSSMTSYIAYDYNYKELDDILYFKVFYNGFDLTDGNEIYRAGYVAGVDKKLSEITPWSIIVSGVNDFLNIELLPSVRLSVVLSVAFGIILLGFVIKIFLGG